MAKETKKPKEDFKSIDLPHVDRMAYPNRHRIVLPRNSMMHYPKD